MASVVILLGGSFIFIFWFFIGIMGLVGSFRSRIVPARIVIFNFFDKKFAYGMIIVTLFNFGGFISQGFASGVNTNGILLMVFFILFGCCCCTSSVSKFQLNLAHLWSMCCKIYRCT